MKLIFVFFVQHNVVSPAKKGGGGLEPTKPHTHTL